ncbi:MAG: hypothetical protein JXX14_15240 [Deltaproteobacteria bacterium]|nr:hypothetical protein [Deltaproteobacteria bacterium]
MKLFTWTFIFAVFFLVACQKSSHFGDDKDTNDTGTFTGAATGSDSTETGTALDSDDKDTDNSSSTNTDRDTQSETETGNDTLSETDTTTIDSALPTSTDSEASDTAIDTLASDSETGDTETDPAETDSDSDNIHRDDSDTGTEEAFIPNCEIGNYANTIAFEGYEHKYFFYGYFVGMCVTSSFDCKGAIGNGEIYSELSSQSNDLTSCAPSEECCMRSCTFSGVDSENENRGWCQRPEQYCHGGISEPSANCGDALVCCSGNNPEIIYLPPCKFSNPPEGYVEDGWCILPEQHCAYGMSDQQSTCDNGLVCCPIVEN